MKRRALVLTSILSIFVIIKVVGLVTVFYNLENKLEEQHKQISSLEEQTEDLQKKINFLLNPKIVTNLGVSDVRREPYRLFIDGHAGNYGFETAFNCCLQVTLFRGSKVVEETSIWLGTIEGGEYVKVRENIHYIGDPLTHWTIDPVFD
jgi:hypothetical protein